MRDQIIAALWAELERQSNADGADAPWVARGAEYAFPPHFAKIDGAIDLGALADVVLEARKRWHRATDPSARLAKSGLP